MNKITLEKIGFKELPNVGMYKFQREDTVLLIDNINKLYVIYKENGNKEELADVDLETHFAINNKLGELGWEQ